jgi:hypothetical protein
LGPRALNDRDPGESKPSVLGASLDGADQGSACPRLDRSSELDPRRAVVLPPRRGADDAGLPFRDEDGRAGLDEHRQPFSVRSLGGGWTRLEQVSVRLADDRRGRWGVGRLGRPDDEAAGVPDRRRHGRDQPTGEARSLHRST